MSITDINLSVLGKNGLQTPVTTAGQSGGGQQFGQMLDQQMAHDAAPPAENTTPTTGPIAQPTAANGDSDTNTKAPIAEENGASDWLSLLAQTQDVLARTDTAAQTTNQTLPQVPSATVSSAVPSATVSSAVPSATVSSAVPSAAQVTAAVPSAATKIAPPSPELLALHTPADKKSVTAQMVLKQAMAVAESATTTTATAITTPAGTDSTQTQSDDHAEEKQATDTPTVATTPVDTPSWSSVMIKPEVNGIQQNTPAATATLIDANRRASNPNSVLSSNDTQEDMTASAAQTLAKRVFDPALNNGVNGVMSKTGAANTSTPPTESFQSLLTDVATTVSGPENTTTTQLVSTAQQTTGISNSHNNTTSATTQHIATPFGSNGWEQAIGQRVLWMAQDKLQTANLTLNPPQLGPVQVTVQLDQQQQATVQFVSASPEVRQALQDALPVLRDLLSQSGIQLGQTNVGSQQFSQREQQQAFQQQNRSNRPPEEISASEESTEPVRQGQGLVNLIA